MFVQKHTQLTLILETGVKRYAENWLQFQSELHEITLTLMIYLRENILKVETVCQNRLQLLHPQFKHQLFRKNPQNTRQWTKYEVWGFLLDFFGMKYFSYQLKLVNQQHSKQKKDNCKKPNIKLF